MDNKITKQRLSNHLEYDWLLYLLIVLVGIFGTYFLFAQINRTRDYEDVTLFVSCYDESTHNFVGQTLAHMNASEYQATQRQLYGDNILRSLTVEAWDPIGNGEYYTLLQTRGTILSDILVVGKSVMPSCIGTFVPLTDELLNDYLLPDEVDVKGNPTGKKLKIEDFDYYTVELENGETRRYGLKISSFPQMHGVGHVFEMDWRNIESYAALYGEAAEEYQPDDEFYICLNSRSENIGKFGKKSKDKNAQALYVFNRFLTYYYRI